MKFVLNSASSIVIAFTVAIVSTVCVTETMSLDIGGLVNDLISGNTTNISSIIDTMLQNNTYIQSIRDTDTVLDSLFNETNTTDAWNVMKEYLVTNDIELAPDGYFEEILEDPTNANYTNYLEGTGIANGTIDWNATYIITELFNRTNLTQTWENIKMNITSMNMSMPNMSMPSPSMGGGDGAGMAPAASPTMDMPTMDMKTMAPVMDKPTMDMKTMAPTMKGNMTNSTMKPPTNSTSAATSTTVKVIGTSFLVVFVTATSSMFFAL